MGTVLRGDDCFCQPELAHSGNLLSIPLLRLIYRLVTMSTPSPAPEPSSYTAMDSDVEAIGRHCEFAYCHQLDFLPFRCDSCHHTNRHRYAKQQRKDQARLRTIKTMGQES